MEIVYVDIDIYPRGNETYLEDSNVTFSFPKIEKVEQAHISMIAPIWKIVGQRTINLDGLQPPSMRKLTTGNIKRDGMDGRQGGNAGSFFGVYSKIENAELLEISANGGNGGNGQDGADGREGAKGRSGKAKFQSGGKQPGMLVNGKLVYATFKKKPLTKLEFNVWHTQFGDKGAQGEKGGNGGKSGPPGYPGHVELVFQNLPKLETKQMVSVSTNQGNWGKPGFGGKGGISGLDGDHESCSNPLISECYTTKNYRRSGNSGQAGSIGGRGNPTSTSVRFSSPTIWKLLIECKASFLLEGSQLNRNFITQLDLNSEIRKHYNLTSFSEEIIMLEEKFLQMSATTAKQKETLYISYYESFLDRFRYFQQQNSLSDQHQLDISAIYSTIFSKLVAIRASENYLNVIKTNEYFEIILEAIETLKSDQDLFQTLNKNKKQQAEVFEDQRNFKRKLNDKIGEAKQFIAETVTPAIAEVKRDLNETNSQLLQEIHVHLSIAKESVEIAKERKQRIKNAAVKNGILGFFGLAAAVLSFLGPEFLVVGSLITAGISIGNAVSDLPPTPGTSAASITSLPALRATLSSFNNKSGSLAYGLFVGSEAVNYFKQISNDIKDVQKIEELIKEAERAVRAIEAKRQQFYDDFIPELFSFLDDITHSTGQTANQSRVALSVKKWQIKGILKNMRGYVNQFTKEFAVGEQFQSRFDSLDEAIVLMIDLYDHIKRYEEKKEFVDYLTKIIYPKETQVLDPNLNVFLKKLKFFISANLFMAEYQKGIHAFKQWAFPFSAQYLKDMKKISTPKTLDDVVNRFTEQTKFLKLQLNKYQATTVNGDEALIVSSFTSKVVSSKPFYIWDNSKWQSSIKQLLNGQKIHVKADVDMNDQLLKSFFHKKAAVKFKSIELFLKAHNSSRQDQLDRKLDHFHVELTHSGISLYKTLGQHFITYDRNQTYRYSYERIGNNSHVAVNVVKNKEDGYGTDFLMSPYTWWTFQLIDVVPGDIGFSDLEEFEREIDLELHGKGLYLDESRLSEEKLNSLKLSDYYEIYDTKTKLIAVDRQIPSNVCSAGD